MHSNDPELRALLAEYNVLEHYDTQRIRRYGDMASSRRAHELNRRADTLIVNGIYVDRDGHFPRSTPDELAAAWARVAAPRLARVERETYRSDTRYSRATIDAWHATLAALNI